MENDNAIKEAFNMLVERLSTIEERLERQERVAMFTESCKRGTLNNEAFGYPFRITRESSLYGTNQIEYRAKVVGLAMSISFDKCKCQKPQISSSSNSNFSKKNYSWTDLDVQKELEILFKDTNFEPVFLKQNFICLFSKTNSSGFYGNDNYYISDYLSEISKLARWYNHSTSCIDDLLISEVYQSTQKCINIIRMSTLLPEGPLKNDWIQKRDAVDRSDWEELSEIYAVQTITDIREFLKGQGTMTKLGKSFILLTSYNSRLINVH
jgi:hypothetical protein